ncbi:MAG: hypothetical protein HQK87_10130 [Nitrospinae bacterium]|nr:hypothetical protein [Nitrospinota bacterium]
MKNIVCLIPARAGSERLKNKHLITINNKTILEISIEQAIESGIFSEIHFSSNDDKLLEIATRYKISIFKRYLSLSESNVPVLAVIQEHIKNIGLLSDDCLCLFQATNILRTQDDIKKGFEIFKQHRGQLPVMSVGVHERPVELYFKIVNGYIENYLGHNVTTARKQDFQPSFFWNDAFIFDSVNSWLAPTRTLFLEKMLPYIMPSERSINIDYPFQALLLQALYEKQGIY